ncbi:hypothetical protein H6G00_01330 [Leptolyngbya sp. FACHB-541]|uniref:hypothetical protein n=1 Tax=Leptolyngbya sp. FACHB-541 TaxID=2692810 RepID=UPI0016854CE6|nr:hypothetical protein [Leptolyngbya sp. FACHB-541]MBD1995272.1 hypothetical protein [Leptolyngbya sp. FACHB-541]
MEFDRIVQDLVAFIHTLLWWRKGEIKEPPYELLGAGIRCKTGILQHIRKNPKPGMPDRLVSSWLFMPYRYGRDKTQIRDLHIDCVWLGPVPGFSRLNKTESRRWKPGDPTHRIEILWASHWVRNDGKFETEQVFSGDYDLQGNSHYPDAYATNIIKDLVLLLRYQEWHELAWAFEIEASRQTIMRLDYTPSKARQKERSETQQNRYLKQGEYWGKGK